MNKNEALINKTLIKLQFYIFDLVNHQIEIRKKRKISFKVEKFFISFNWQKFGIFLGIISVVCSVSVLIMLFI